MAGGVVLRLRGSRPEGQDRQVITMPGAEGRKEDKQGYAECRAGQERAVRGKARLGRD